MYAPDEARYFHDLVASLLGKASVFPEYKHYVAQIHSLLSLVRAGLGVALVPMAAMQLHYDGVVFRKLGGNVPARPVELHLVWKEDNQNPLLPRLVDALADNEA